MRALPLLLLLAATPAQSQCLIACDAESSGAEAAARLRHDLGGPLPEGTKVVGLLEGGFQDRFVQARLSVAAKDLPTLLATMRVAEGDLRPMGDPYLGPPGPAWFEWEGRDGLSGGHGWTGTFPHLTVVVAPDPSDPDRRTVFIWAFQT